MAELAYPQAVYTEENTSIFDTARFRVGGLTHVIRYRIGESAVMADVPRNVVATTLQGYALPGELLGGLRLSIDGAKAWTHRFLASGDLFSRKFDLYTSIPKPARKRLHEAWKKIAALPKAFEFAPSFVARGRSSVEVAQSISDSVLAGTKYKATATQSGRFGGNSVALQIEKNGVSLGSGTIEFLHERSGNRAVMHTEMFTKGSGAGKPFYQVAFAFADAYNATVSADSNGLLAVNTYRRTEQQFSAALRSGLTSNVQPGYGQRIYGWNARTSTKDQQDRNMVRLALAAARNAAEFFPGIQDISYDIAADKFSFQDGSSADSMVEIALAGQDARAVSLSRSTMARAALTFQAIRGELDLDGITEAKKPVLYSARVETSAKAEKAKEPAVEVARAEPVYTDLTYNSEAVYPRLAGRKVKYQVRVADTGEIATFTVGAQEAMSDLDSRLNTMRKLISCLCK
jgi:hypothetical protein